MDNALIKSRFQSNSFTGRKKYGGREKLSFKEKLGLQIAICVIILMLAGIVRNTDTEVSNSLKEKVGTALSQDIDVKQISSPIMGFLSGLFDQGSNGGDADIINPVQDSSSWNSADAKKGNGASISPKDTDNIASQDSLEAAASQSPGSAVKYKGLFVTPATGILGSTFGDTVDQLTQKTKSHKGVDIEAANGTEIKAAAGGIVLESAFEKTLGYYVKIEHSNGYSTIYGQCSKLIAQKGQNVNQGDVIAKVGSTGVSTGSHLHFEIWKDGKAVNPLDYIKVP